VDDDRQVKLAREPDLRREDRLLHVARREVVVVVEPDLADRRRCARGERAAHRRHRVAEPPRPLPRLVRVDPGGEADLRPCVAHPRGTRGLGLVARDQDAERAVDAGLARAGDDVEEVSLELLPGEMAV
jgi:hypothetical protein